MLFQELVANLKVDHIRISYGKEGCIVVGECQKCITVKLVH